MFGLPNHGNQSESGYTSRNHSLKGEPMKVYTMQEVVAGDFSRKNQAVSLRRKAEAILKEGEEMLLSDLIRQITGKFDMAAYASARACFTPRNGFRIYKQGKRIFVIRGGTHDQ